MYHTFTYKHDDERGYSGWVLNSKPFFDPMRGLGVAHDVLEEMPHGGEQPHDEAMALGAMIYGRGAHCGVFFNPIETTIAYEFDELFEHAFEEEGYRLQPAPNTRPLRGDEDREETEELIQKIIHILKTRIQTIPNDLHLYTDAQIQQALEWLPHATSWLRIGFRRAAKRFYRLGRYEVYSLFQRIEKEVDKLKPELGDQITVRVSYRRCDVNIYMREYFPEW